MMEPIKLVCTVIYFLVKPLIKCSRNTAAAGAPGPAPGGATRQNRPGGTSPYVTHVLPFASVKLKTRLASPRRERGAPGAHVATPTAASSGAKAGQNRSRWSPDLNKGGFRRKARRSS